MVILFPSTKTKCIVKTENNKFFFTAKQHNNMYEIDLIDPSQQNVTYMLSKEDERWL